jgi:hypothetical protein
MKIRYNPVIAIVFIVLGVICLFLGLWLSMLEGFQPAILPGLLCPLIGILYLTRPYFWVHPMLVELPALVGPIKREFQYQTLELNGRKLVAVRDDGTRKKVPVARWLAHSGDWAAVTAGSARPAS